MPQTRAPSHVPSRTQAPCCYTAAMEDAATYCGECGKPLIRCIAFEECGGLLDDNGLCTICIAPLMQIDAGALTAARVGGAVALPVTLANISAIGRPLFVTHLWSRESKGDWREESLGWERLEQGETRSAAITADQMERTGAHRVQILIALASRWRWRQECYAFTAQFTLQIEADDTSAAPVVNIGGDSAGHGNTVYISGQSSKDHTLKTSEKAFELKLVRAEKEERRLDLRGLDPKLWLPRHTDFKWSGFHPDDTPASGPILTSDGILSAGRSRVRATGGPGDVRLLIENARDEIDEATSRMVSRRHFELYIECDRLVLRVTGSGGLRVNGEAYGPGKTIGLSDGDVIAPLVKAVDAVTLKTSFQTEHGRVRTVTFTRSPASQRES